MSEFIKGTDLCEGFFNEYAKPIIEKHFPNLKHSAGLIGYGSDVLGYDDAVSNDHTESLWRNMNESKKNFP